MVAAPYKGTLVFMSERGQINTQQITASDVAAAAFVFQDGQTQLTLGGVGKWFLRDVILTGTGTDTTKTEIFVGSKSTGEYILNPVNQSTTVTRQFASAPIAVYAGNAITFIQRA